MNPAYKEINQSRARFLVFWGGAGSGKSVNIARLLVSRLTFGPPGVHWLVVRKDKDANSDSTRAELVNAINAILGDQADDWWDVPASRLTLTNKRNGNSFIFRGVKDESQREKLKSITVSSGNIEGAWVEEATQILPTDFDQINARLRGKLPEGHYYQTILTFNPVSSTHWLKRRFFDRKDPDAVTCHTTWRDNRFLNADYGRELAKTAETFQSTSPTRGDDFIVHRSNRRLGNFNPRPLREGTTFHRHGTASPRLYFNPRPLREGTTFCLHLRGEAH